MSRLRKTNFFCPTCLHLEGWGGGTRGTRIHQRMREEKGEEGWSEGGKGKCTERRGGKRKSLTGKGRAQYHTCCCALISHALCPSYGPCVCVPCPYTYLCVCENLSERDMITHSVTPDKSQLHPTHPSVSQHPRLGPAWDALFRYGLQAAQKPLSRNLFSLRQTQNLLLRLLSNSLLNNDRSYSMEHLLKSPSFNYLLLVHILQLNEDTLPFVASGTHAKRNMLLKEPSTAWIRYWI